MEGGCFCSSEVVERMKPAMGMVLVQVVFAGINIFYKLVINDGMDMRIMIAYRYLFATAFLGPLAFFMERNKRPRFTWTILFQSFLCGLFGGTVSQNTYITSIRLTSTSFAAAMANLTPAVTFILAVIFRMEKLAIGTPSGQAKVFGTVLGVGGAMLLTFYKGVEIEFWRKNIHLLHGHGEEANQTNPHKESGNQVLGSMLAIISCFTYSIWLILQAKLSEVFPCPYSLTALMCAMCTVQSLVFAVAMDRDWSQWRIGLGIRLLAVAYAGILASGLGITLMAWCINRKGPLFASVFTPLMLVIVAILGSIFLDEKLYLGSILGAVLIVFGLYMVLWGKGHDAAKKTELQKSDAARVEVVIVPNKEVQDEAPQLMQEERRQAKS